MGIRRNARENALQVLFQIEFNSGDLDEVLEEFRQSRRVKEKEREYGEHLVRGVIDHREEIDKIIQSHSKNWRISRMDLIDRNLLRLAAFEMIYQPDLAPAIIINEAVEIAKKYGGKESATFINGILDELRRECHERQ